MTAEKSQKFRNLQGSVAESAWAEVVLKILVLKIIGKSQQKWYGGGVFDDQTVCLSKATSNTQQTNTCSYSTTETPEKDVKSVQS